MKKIIIVASALALSAAVMFGCAGNDTSASSSSQAASSSSPAASSSSAAASSSSAAESASYETQYVTPEQLKNDMDAGMEKLLLLDVRKLADYDAGHIEGAITVDMDNAKNGDTADGEATMAEGLAEATGSDTAEGYKMVLICYSGKSYAAAGEAALSAIGADMDNVFTLEGGMQAWEAAYPGSLVTE